DVLGRFQDRLHDVLGRAPAGDVIERRTDAAAFLVDRVALDARHLALLVGEQLAARDRIALEVRLPRRLAGGSGEAANVQDQLGDLLFLEGIAELFHGGPGHALADNAGDVLVLVAVAELAARQVGALAAAAGAAVATAAQAAEECLALF